MRVSDQPCSEVSAGELVKRAAENDRAAWEALIDRYTGRVWSIVRTYGLSEHSAQDAAQTVWLNFADHLSRLRDPEHVGAWLATTARNECLKQMRLSRSATPVDPSRLDSADHATPEELHMAAERSRRLREAIAGLGDPDRAVAELELHEPRTSAEQVAEAAGLHPHEVPAVRRRVRRRLRRLLIDLDSRKGA